MTKKLKNTKILIVGLTYKYGVADMRNSLNFEIYKKIKKNINKTFAYDPFSKANNFTKPNNLSALIKFDIIIIYFIVCQIKRKKKFDKKSIDLSKNKNNILNFESENLAKIFIKQNKPNKAIKIYKKLILKNSEKKAYFAKKIEELNN